MIFRRLKRRTREEEQELIEQIQREKPDKGDVWIMLWTAMLNIFLPVSLFLVGLALLVMWIFGIL